MKAATFDTAAHARAARAAGHWLDQTMDDLLAAAKARLPRKLALAAYRADRETPVRIDYAELESRVARVAASLRALGIGRGDVVAVQLPNWWEFVVTAFACARVGAATNVLMPIFRENELRYMLGFSAAKLLVLPHSFRGFDHAAMAASLKQQLPSLRHVAVVDGEGEDSFERLLHNSGAGEMAADPAIGLRPDDMAILIFTSGTTGQPKGVMHSCNTLVACADALIGGFHLTTEDALLCCSPLGHMTGYALMLRGLRLAASVALQDVWDPKRAAAIMAAEAITHTAAATPFLADICDEVAAGGARPERLRTFLCSGATIPPVLIERAASELGLMVSSHWGMTESLASTLTRPEHARAKSAKTDGCPLPGVEVQVVDDQGRHLPVGETGRLMVRGAQMFLGYYKRPDIKGCDAEGWLDTGDLAYMDADGYIRINGRTKDVLVRGGENVPVVEIESLLYKHPAVAAVAIVGYPDARMGERACAFLVLRPGANLDLAGVQSYLEECRVTRQYWPERVEVLEELPRTASGKIQKFILKDRARAYGDALTA